MSDEVQDISLQDNGKSLLAGKMAAEKLHLRSELVHEFISHQRDFFERWALPIFLGFLLLLLAGAWFFNYPDIVESKAILVAANAPKEIIPRAEGRLVKLFVHNDQAVKKGDMIGWIESTADHREVILLSALLDSSVALMDANRPGQVSHLFDNRFNRLGELQAPYRQFITAWQQFNDYLVNGFYPQRKKLLQYDVLALQQMNGIVHLQKKYSTEDLDLANESFKMNDVLLHEKVISQEQYRVEKSKLVGKQAVIPQIDASIISNQTQQRDKQKEIQQIEHDEAQQKIIFLQALQSLKSETDDWLKKYTMQSPIDGKIFLLLPLQENRFLQAGRLLGYVKPPDTRFYAEAWLPQNNFGKLDTGLSVQLRFDAYPYQEFGFVSGTLTYISNVASDSGFLATIRLDKGLVTNRHKPISYMSGLKANGIIITKDMRLLQRFYYNITKAVSAGSK